MKHLFYILFVLMTGMSLAGSGDWVSRYALSEVGLGLDYSIYEPVRVGQDVRVA